MRWLLTQDVEPWLARPRHRALVGACVVESRSRRTCLTHPVRDPLLQDVADALGDRSLRSCRFRSTRVQRWSKARTQAYDLASLTASALDATRRLSRWYAAGVRGSDAWELTLNNVTPSDLPGWHAAGFTTAEAAAWSGRESLARSVRWRGVDVAPYGPLRLPLAPMDGAATQRGLSGYARWQLSRRGRSGELLQCTLCGAKDYSQPCRTCRAEGRAGALQHEWAAYTDLKYLHPAYGDIATGPRVPCGAGNCQGSLALSAADEGVRQ